MVFGKQIESIKFYEFIITPTQSKKRNPVGQLWSLVGINSLFSKLINRREKKSSIGPLLTAL